jgi:hypothetical protein
MGYRATQKQYIIKENTIITPDNFGSWELINYGTNPVIINDTIVLQQGEKYKVELDSDVIFESSINIKFDTTTAGSNRAAMIQFYVKPI